jgi:hypothetical protein
MASGSSFWASAGPAPSKTAVKATDRVILDKADPLNVVNR